MNLVNFALQNADSQQQHRLVEAAGGPGSLVSTTYDINSSGVLTKLKYLDPILSSHGRNACPVRSGDFIELAHFLAYLIDEKKLFITT